MKRLWAMLLGLTLLLSACGTTSDILTPEATATGHNGTVEAEPTVLESEWGTEPTPTSTVIPSEVPRPIPDDVPVYSDPITGFYDTLVYDSSYGCTSFWYFLVGSEAKAWEREARHIFDVLKENAHPQVLEFIDLEQVEKDFFTYVDTQSYLDAYIEYTDLLGDESGSWSEHISRGTGFSVGEMEARITRYRYFVESWYEALTFDQDKQTLDCYVFSAEEELGQLAAGNGLQFSEGAYQVDPKAVVEEKELENPIDEWTERWLGQDGTTGALIADAYTKSEIWLEELSHAYDVFAENANPVAELTNEIEAARDALIRFAPQQGDCIALAYYSNAFAGSEQEHDFSAGSIARSARWSVCAEYYRHETLRLWIRLLDRLGWDQPTWVFEPSGFEEEILGRYPGGVPPYYRFAAENS